MRLKTPILILATLFSLSISASAAFAGIYSRVELADPGPFGGTGEGVSDNGLVVGTSYLNTNRQGRAASFSTTLVVDLSVLPGGTYSAAHAISPNGLITVGQSGSGSGNTQAVRWNGAMQSLPGLALGGDSRALDVTDAGEMVGSARSSTLSLKPVVWSSSGQVQQLPTFDVDGDGSATVITSSGMIAGWSTQGGFMKAGLWSSDRQSISGVGGLGVGSFEQTWISGLSEDGHYAAGVSSYLDPNLGAVSQGVLWHDGVPLNIGGSDVFVEVNAMCVVDSEIMLGGRALFDGSVHAFIWTAEDGVVDLNTMVNGQPSDWLLYSIESFNSSGHMTGYERNSLGLERPCLIVPGAGTTSPFFMLGFIVVRRRR